jgi:ankyrin repeat protein
VVEELIKQGIDMRALSSLKRTPVHCAAQQGHFEMCKILIEAGIDKNIQDVDQNTALHLASESGHSTVIVYLVKDAGADATLKNKYGYSASDIAHDFSIR